MTTKNPKKPIVPRSGKFFRRDELARRARVKIAEIETLMQKGLLRATYKERTNHCLFTEEDVQVVRTLLGKRDTSPEIPKRFLRKERSRIGKIARIVRRSAAMPRYTPAQAESVWTMIEAGAEIFEILQQTKIHPIIIEEIMIDRSRVASTINLMKIEIDFINKLPFDPKFLPLESSSDLIDLLYYLAHQPIATCAVCGDRPRAKVCSPCMKSHLREKMAAAATSGVERSTSSDRV